MQVKTLIAMQVTSVNICGFLLQPVSLLVSFAMVTSKESFFPIHPPSHNTLGHLPPAGGAWTLDLGDAYNEKREGL